MIEAVRALAQFALDTANKALAAAGKAYSDAKAWARTQIDNAVAYVGMLITIAQAYALAAFNTAIGVAVVTLITIINDAKQYAINLVFGALAKIEDAKNLAKHWIDVASVALTAFVLVVKGQLEVFIATAVAPFMPLINWLQGLIAGIQVAIAAAVNFLTVDMMGKLLHTVDDVVPFVQNFMDDPIGFIAALVQAFLIPMIEVELAYALGTTTKDLPPKPNWSELIGFGDGNTVVLIDAKDASLVKPLVSLYVSGNRFQQGHPGTDYGLQMGQPIYACHAGHASVGNCGDPRYGVCVRITGSEWSSLYAHLQIPKVGSGQFVKQGQLIGLGDSTGNSTGPHLHIELQKNGVYVNPEAVL